MDVWSSKSRLREQLPAAPDQDLAGVEPVSTFRPVSAVKFTPIPARSCSLCLSTPPRSCHCSSSWSMLLCLLCRNLCQMKLNLSQHLSPCKCERHMYVLTWFYKMLTSHGIFNICVWNSVVPSRFPNIFNLQIFTTVGSDCGELDYIPSFGATLSFAFKKYFCIYTAAVS